MYWLLPRTRYLLCLSLLCLLAQNNVYAASNPGDQELIRDRQNRLLEEQRRRLEELKELPGKEAVPTAPSAPVDSERIRRNLSSYKDMIMQPPGIPR